MIVTTVPLVYQVFYAFIATAGIIGNFFIVMVTIKSRSLRSICNIIIALISVGDILQMCGLYVMVISYHLIPGHLMKQSDCVYWQFLPACGIFLSATWILGVAIDRLLSLQKFYVSLIQNYRVAYLIMHLVPVLTAALAFCIWIYIDRDENLKVVCSITASWPTGVYGVITRYIMTVNVLIILCYAVFLYQLKKSTAGAGNDKMRNIYKSLIVTSFTVVFGYFTTTFIGTAAQVLNLDIPRAYVDLFAGTFVTTTCSFNIFVYYFISKEYRIVFQKHLCCRVLKKAKVQAVTLGPGPRRNQSTGGKEGITVI